MSRYFIEVTYKGTKYAGFQVQLNANTIQAEIEKALLIYCRQAFQLTGSSRTDAGVHAKQNYFHFDNQTGKEFNWEQVAYHLNAILPDDIVIKSINSVSEEKHCRFDALSRTYEYTLYNAKDPFLDDRAYYYPYPLQLDLLNEAAMMIKNTENFETFSKRNTQVQTYICSIFESHWKTRGEHEIVYTVKGNRFLRGMVRGLVGTMLKVGTKKIDLAEFAAIIQSHNVMLADFSMPAKGLSLINVAY